ncbi:MAG: ATP-dependent DNA helicase RecG [candidate division Zixibacteria bacterium]|jgi:ATP-dependent DNA helicase RecG|nr:ATP-dependent DNA helicase RecG [candidate division Zixibacteria bacterium]
MSEISLSSSLQFLKGVGPRKAAVLQTHGMETVRDLLFYFPRRYLDRTNVSPINRLQVNQTTTIIGEVKAHGILRGRKTRYEVILQDDTAAVSLTFFQGVRYWQKLFKKGQVYAATGRVTFFQGLQMIHPDLERLDSDSDQMVHAGRIIPVYPQTSELSKVGLSSKGIRSLTTAVFGKMRERLPDALPPDLRQGMSLMPLHEAVAMTHYPSDREVVETARRRLAFDELLALQFFVYRNRGLKTSVTKPHRFAPPGAVLGSFKESLPFSLTDGQKSAVKEIFADLQKAQPMSRLLQGDVGCGKTAVAVAASVYAAENKLQTAFMAPTEILAEQHFRNWAQPLARLGITVDLITSALSSAERKKRAQRAASGETDILLGTHALIYDYVAFERLGLVVIDEQHRFGVRQRGLLYAKGNNPDLLVMTATPIPRTLALTLYGDLDISTIRDLPPGRKPVRTAWRTESARLKVMQWVRDEVLKGGQAYVVYPLIEKSDQLELRNAEEAFEELRGTVFAGIEVGLVHGRVKPRERDEILAAFRDGDVRILMATTVIEVGLDNPRATLLVIEQAERFGLAQLHQLRGRVGRGADPATVVALAGDALGDMARRRLEYFAGHADGFEIAEADLELRGPGELFGTRQSGMPELRVADLSKDRDLLEAARRLVMRLFEHYNDLDSDHRALYSFLEKAAGRREVNLGGG